MATAAVSGVFDAINSDTTGVKARVRTDIWEHEGILGEYWSKGMIAIGSQQQRDLVDECSMLTGLTHVQIKVLV